MNKFIFVACIALLGCHGGKEGPALPAGSSSASSSISSTTLTGTIEPTREEESSSNAPHGQSTTSSPNVGQGYDASENRLYPIDEALKDPSLTAFRQRLLSDVRKHDAAAVLSVVDPEIRVSFGDENGRKAFSKQWKLDGQDSPFWHVMERILVNGGSFQEPAATPRRFIAPYVYSEWPEAIDSFENLAVVGSEARMRSKPDGPEIGKLHYDIVKIAADDPGRKGVADSAWRHVVVRDGKPVWLAADDLYSPLGYRAFFEKTPEGWMLTTLVAGD